jgi:hypothetical protein
LNFLAERCLELLVQLSLRHSAAPDLVNRELLGLGELDAGRC